MAEFKSTNEELASFVVSVYVLRFAIGPLIIAPYSEMYGRLIFYPICNFLFLVFTVACAVSPTLNALIVFRFLAEGVSTVPPVDFYGSSLLACVAFRKREFY
jgi:MFS family permease